MARGEVRVLDYSDYREFFNKVKETQWIRRGHPLTLNQIAHRLGYNSPRLISMILKGQRFPSSDFIDRVSQDLKLTASSKKYLKLLVEYEKRKAKGKDISEVVNEIAEFYPTADYDLELKSIQFKYISHWQTLVIRQLRKFKGVSWTPPKIRAFLKNKISTEDVRSSLDVLNSLGFLRPDVKNLKTSFDIPDSAIRTHHKEMLARATEALDEEEVDKREIMSLTMPFDSEDVKEAKLMIRNFVDQFNKRFESENPDTVYQLNFQFFPHTKRMEVGDA